MTRKNYPTPADFTEKPEAEKNLAKAPAETPKPAIEKAPALKPDTSERAKQLTMGQKPATKENDDGGE